jgi:hypothetical protein
VSPGHWHEVTCLRGGRMVGYLRFVERREGGMTICEMPQITRFLGPVVTPQSGKTEARIRSTHSIITELLKQIAGYDHVEMTLDPGFSDLAPFLASGYEVKVHPTFLLDCKREIEDLWAGLRDKTRNVIRRAREHLMVRFLQGKSRRCRILLRPFVDGPCLCCGSHPPTRQHCRGNRFKWHRALHSVLRLG